MSFSPTAPGEESAPPAPLSLVILGSGEPVAFGQASTSYLIDGVARILVDGGSGASTRLGESRINIPHLDMLLLTHSHIDHAAEVPSILKARVIMRRAEGEIDFLVFGPEGRGTFPSTSEFIRLLFEEQGAFAYLKTFGGAVVGINGRSPVCDRPDTY